MRTFTVFYDGQHLLQASIREKQARSWWAARVVGTKDQPGFTKGCINNALISSDFLHSLCFMTNIFKRQPPKVL